MPWCRHHFFYLIFFYLKGRKVNRFKKARSLVQGLRVGYRTRARCVSGRRAGDPRLGVYRDQEGGRRAVGKERVLRRRREASLENGARYSLIPSRKGERTPDCRARDSAWEARFRSHRSVSTPVPSRQPLTETRNNLPAATAIFSARGSRQARRKAAGAGPVARGVVSGEEGRGGAWKSCSLPPFGDLRL